MKQSRHSTAPTVLTRRTLGAGIAATTALALAACGGGGGGPETDDSAGDGTTLVIWADETQGPVLKNAVDAVKADYGLDFEVKEYAEDLQENYLNAVEQGNGPDIVVGAHDWAGAVVSAGGAEALHLDTAQTDALNPASVSAFTMDGQLYGIPYAVENLGLFRNTELAPDEPAAFEDLIADAEKAGTERSLVVQQGEDGDPYHGYPIYSSMGGYLFGYDPDEGFDAADIGIDSEGGVAALEKFAELGEEGVLSTSVSSENAVDLFVKGEAPYMITGPWSVGAVTEAGVDFEVGAIPGFEGEDPAAPFLGAQGFYVNPDGENKASAVDFATRALFDEAFLDIVAQDGGREPAHLNAAAAFTRDNAVNAGFAAAGENSLPMPNIPAMGAVWEPLGRAMADCINGNTTGREAAETAAKTVRDEVEG
ncbi:sugar ABC transporter substrate-binding protein [Salininema proteolyticum]|uniref:Extracellular solute-binding protein n=1 Tax=Salininema proteolyticum TaxID=1607685 RepID=A0ABV8TXI1_9ACTN